MAKERLLIHGSSWTVGAYQKSNTQNVDELVAGGIAELLSVDNTVTNISVQDNMNLGIWMGLREHLKNNLNYDKILICQNDPSLDFGIWRNNDTEWLKQFPYTLQELRDSNVNTISGVLDFLLDKFYSKLGEVSEVIPVYIFAGPTKINVELALKYKLYVIEPDWMSTLVPEIESSYVESSIELDYVMQWLLNEYPSKKVELKTEFIEMSEKLNEKLSAYKSNPDLFAYHHPTVLGNKIYYQKIKEVLG